MRIVVAVTGATGAILGVRLLQALHGREQVDIHMVVSKWGRQTLEHETDHDLGALRALATASYAANDLSAPIASGSFPVDAMVVVPCSMRTLAAIARGTSENLIHRAAEVTLKEGRRLVLVPREMPLSAIHLDNMLTLARLGVRILPPVPAFYNKPETIDDLVNHIVARILDQIGVDADFARRWDGRLGG